MINNYERQTGTTAFPFAIKTGPTNNKNNV